MVRLMSDLEDLKNLATQFLRWHRDRYYPVAAQISAVLPNYRHLSDREIPDQPFKQSDAQELIARKAGFGSWEALRDAHRTSAGAQAQPLCQATLLAAEPQLFVSDIATSCEFYVQMLGFAVAFTYGKPPFYGQAFRQGARLNLRCLDKAGIDPERRDRDQLLSASVALDDARPLFSEYQAAGVVFAQTLRTEPWGARTFIVRDPDGNLILFADPGD